MKGNRGRGEGEREGGMGKGKRGTGKGKGREGLHIFFEPQIGTPKMSEYYKSQTEALQTSNLHEPRTKGKKKNVPRVY